MNFILVNFSDSRAAECISIQPQPPPAPKWTADETAKGNTAMVRNLLLV